YSSFSSGSVGFRPYLSAFWSDLYNAGAAIILNGHSHNYERFAPQDPAGNVDTLRGVVEFIVGTGGQKAYRPDSSIRVNSVVRGGDNGVIKFTLSDAGYSWQFIPVARATFTDSGSGMCPGNQPPVARPGGPYKSESAVAFDGSASSDPNQNVPLSYAWDFGDGATGTGVAPTHTYAAEGVYTVTLVVTDTKGLASQPATTTASIANQPPVVHAGADAWIPPGGTYRLSATVSEPGGAGWAPATSRVAIGRTTKRRRRLSTPSPARSSRRATMCTRPGRSPTSRPATVLPGGATRRARAPWWVTRTISRRTPRATSNTSGRQQRAIAASTTIATTSVAGTSWCSTAVSRPAPALSRSGGSKPTSRRAPRSARSRSGTIPASARLARRCVRV